MKILNKTNKMIRIIHNIKIKMLIYKIKIILNLNKNKKSIQKVMNLYILEQAKAVNI